MTVTNKTSTAIKAARAHQRMRGILKHHQEKPWTAWVVLVVLLFPVLMLLALMLFG